MLGTWFFLLVFRLLLFLEKLQVAEIIKEDLWPNPLTYFNNVIPLPFSFLLFPIHAFPPVSFFHNKCYDGLNHFLMVKSMALLQEADEEEFEGDEEVNGGFFFFKIKHNIKLKNEGQFSGTLLWIYISEISICHFSFFYSQFFMLFVIVPKSV